MSLYIIGCGGVGSWLAPSLCMLAGRDNIVLVDGDNLEEKNLNRQLFSPQAIGHNKAWALAQVYNCSFEPVYYSSGSIEVNKYDWLIGCVDNHPARAAILSTCDSVGCRAIIAANETHSAEAYFYQPDWRGCPLDPRVYYRDILQDTAGDPLAANSGCTGLAQVERPQLASANFMAAALAQQLYIVWGQEASKLEPETLDHLPYRLRSNLTRLESFKVKEAHQ